MKCTVVVLSKYFLNRYKDRYIRPSTRIYMRLFIVFQGVQGTAVVTPIG
jgi:hypothetical protein